MNAVVAGTVLGLAFAALDLAWLWPMDEWRTGVERVGALTATALARFASGFLVGVLDVGIPGWLLGVAIGVVLSLPLMHFDCAPRRVLAIGFTGGLWIGVLASVLRMGGGVA